MRLALYIRTVTSARGAERVVVNLARGLAERGHQVDFLVEQDGAWLTQDLRARNPGVRVIDLRSGAARPGADRLWLLAAFVRHLLAAPRTLLAGGDACLRPVARILYDDAPPVRALVRYLRQARPRAILSFLNYPNAVLLLAARLAGGDTRVLVSVRNHMSAAAAKSESRWVRSVPRLMRGLFGLADRVIAPSHGVAQDVLAITGLPAERVSVVYNPVFRPELEALADAPAGHPWLSDGNRPVVLGSGKFKPQKDFPTLLRAFARIRAERPARLLLLGEGKEATELRALAGTLGIAEDVDFPGHLQNPFAYYRRAAVFVLSSQWEGLPNALIEAMACGCPVVSTDCPSGPREILEDGRYGALVPVGDAEAMARAVLATLEAPPPRSRLVERARAFSLERAVLGFEAAMVG